MVNILRVMKSLLRVKKCVVEGFGLEPRQAGSKGEAAQEGFGPVPCVRQEVLGLRHPRGAQMACA